uniref:HlyD family type I secretion periplasmic adaptor subunit n=1 Tax=Marinobacterium profundum TaxID=1714300 RepID=UPI00082D5A4F|nr:HlyD family type I secretion periplasmic adaptor subunit [Marinobacterium profundum]
MTSLPRDQLPEVPVRPRATILFGLALVLFTLGGFGLWATLAPLAEAVVAGGTIKVDSSRKQIQHLEGGIVKDILVRDGDRVKQGEVLVRLDETRAAASVAILRDGYDATLAQEARLLAERDGLDSVIFPDSLTARVGDPKVDSILKSQVILWEARRSALEGEVNILKKQVAQLQQDISGYEAQANAKSRQLVFVGDELDSIRELQKKGLSGKKPVLELAREAAELEGDRAGLRSQMGATETEISRKELEVFQVGKSFRQNVVDELKKIQADINDYRERLNAAEHLYGQTEIRAPVDGVVVGSGVHTIGGVISPGQTLLQLVPVNDKLIVEARINPQDIDKVRTGLPAGIKLTAFNQRTTPELAGELRYVSADALQDPQSEMIYYVARIEVSRQEIKRLGEKPIQPGMAAEVFIRTGERTMADYLLQPLQDSFRRAWLED